MGKHGKCSHDIEACYPPGADGGMYPYMMESPQLRWAFIRKVYAIVCLQLLLTVAVAAAVNLVGPIADFFLSRTIGAIAATIAVIIFPILGTSARASFSTFSRTCMHILYIMFIHMDHRSTSLLDRCAIFFFLKKMQ